MKNIFFLIAILFLMHKTIAQKNDSLFINNIDIALKNPLKVRDFILEGKFIDTITFKCFINLESVYLVNCNSELFLEIASHFKKLVSIIIDRNVNYLPMSIKNCKNLKSLVFANCEINQIPSFIGDLESLRELCFSRCSTTEISISLFKLKKLGFLHITLDSKEEQEIIRKNLPNCKCEFR